VYMRYVNTTYNILVGIVTTNIEQWKQTHTQKWKGM
jgi:hypothetical protein